MKAMILAAGRGERMKPLTDATPKALLEVGGVPLIERHIIALSGADVDEIVINVAWLGELIKSRLGNGSNYGVKISYSEEQEGALETGGGILHAMPLLGPEPFWLINSDIFTDFSFPKRILSDGDLAHLVLVKNPEHNSSGDFNLHQGRITTPDRGSLTYSGIGILREELFFEKSPGYFPLAPLFSVAADLNKISGEYYEGLWMDIGTPDRLKKAANT
ncbi:MAG: nucleotidyltransferase family protein [Pseudomonadota bacterium]|nr:nucleotidyltransferase family protein [Pseudomonadota bacterium]